MVIQLDEISVAIDAARIACRAVSLLCPMIDDDGNGNGRGNGNGHGNGRHPW